MGKEGHVLSADFKRKYPRVTSGKGIYMYEEDGTEIIDGASGPVLVSLGHGVTEIADAMHEQAKKVAFLHRDDCINPVLEESCNTFAEASNGDMDKTFQVAGGSEANEMAIKLARNYHLFRGNSGKYKILSRWQSYHGISMGALTISGMPARRANYTPYLVDYGHIAPCYCYRCWFNKEPKTCDCECARALEDQIKYQDPNTVSAFIAEPIGGMSLCAAAPLNEKYFKIIREICTKYDVVLICDEVMTGWGRTGINFAYQRYGIKPDIVTTGKAVSGGYFPLAAASVSKEFYDSMYDNNGNFAPGYSWSGNPLGAAVQLAAYKYINEHNLIENCKKQGAYLKGEIEKLVETHKMIGDVRGEGLMIGIELVKDRETKESFDPKLKMATQVQDQAIEDKMIIEASSGCNKGYAGDGLVISPAFVITEEECDIIVDRLDSVMKKVEKKNNL